MKNISIPSIIDIEASGFGTSSYPIEVGIIRGDGQRYCKLIRPFNDWVFWDNQAQKIHGISRELLRSNGESGVQVCLELNAFLGHGNVFSDGWVVDSPWLKTLFARAQVKMVFQISALEMILKETQIDIWDTTKQQVISSLGIERHRASNDALIVQQTYIDTKCNI
ncbi:MAG: hypothetical protein ACJA0G_001621 [Kangiellaceae bacterium]|jgi:hypothetical protein